MHTPESMPVPTRVLVDVLCLSLLQLFLPLKTNSCFTLMDVSRTEYNSSVFRYLSVRPVCSCAFFTAGSAIYQSPEMPQFGSENRISRKNFRSVSQVGPATSLAPALDKRMIKQTLNNSSPIVSDSANFNTVWLDALLTKSSSCLYWV